MIALNSLFSEASQMNRVQPDFLTHDHTISALDMRTLIQILRKLHDLPPDPVLRRRQMLEDLCQATGASAALSIVMDFRKKPPQKRVRSVVHVGLASPAKRKLLDQWLQTLSPPDPACVLLTRLMLEHAHPLTLFRHQLVRDENWYGSPHVQQIRRTLGVDDCLYSSFPIDGTPLIGILCLSRPWGHDYPFESRDRQVVHLLHSEVDWLYRDPAAPTHEHVGRLTPRQRQSLHCLLDGNSEKQIAARLGLSRHTVHVHIKALYRQMHVNSRGELMARFVPR